jgi:outer membrane biosynthesis protein TonB
MRTNGFRRMFSLTVGGVLLAACLWILAGSSAAAQSASGDGNLQAAVASALTHDAVLKNQPVTAYTANGVVTLSGTVETEQQRQEAETVAANVPGVSGIQNNITVTGSDSAQAPNAPPPPADAQQAPPPPPADNQQPAAAPDTQQIPPPPPPDQPVQPAQQAPRAPYPQGGYGQQPYGGYNNYPPPQQTSGPVTIPAGTLLQIRVSEPLDIAKLQDGAAFQATAASDVFEGNVLAIPRGAVLQGTVVKVKKPGALGGSGELELQISSVNLGGRVYPVVSDIWSNKGPNKAGYTAGNTVGGAAVGALIGGLLGRGPGAAVGAVVGGGAGLAASGATNGPRLYLPAEALLNFHLTNAVTVQPVSWQEAQRLAQSVPQLQRRPVYMAPPYPYGYPYPYPYRVYGW